MKTKLKPMVCTKCGCRRWFVSGYDDIGFFNKCCTCKTRFEGVAKAFGMPQRLSADARREKAEQAELESRGQQSLVF